MIKMMITCVATFTLCWLPLNTVTVIGDQKPEIWRWSHIMSVWTVSHWLAMSHTMYNPFIYFTMNSKFRLGLKHTLRFMPFLDSNIHSPDTKSLNYQKSKSQIHKHNGKKEHHKSPVNIKELTSTTKELTSTTKDQTSNELTSPTEHINPNHLKSDNKFNNNHSIKTDESVCNEKNNSQMNHKHQSYELQIICNDKHDKLHDKTNL